MARRLSAEAGGATEALRRVNLNLLPVLRELLRHRSVTRAAEALDLGQSTVSGALARLRELFGDELLIPRGRSMELTDRAEALIEPLEALLEQASRLVASERFDAARASRRFRIMTADYGAALVGPGLLAALATKAPGVTVQFVSYTPDAIAALKRGALDLALVPDRALDWLHLDEREIGVWLDREPLLDDPTVCLVRASAAPAGPVLPLEEFRRRPQVAFHLSDELAANVAHEALVRAGVTPPERLRAPSFTLLPLLVAASECVALVPASLAERVARHLPLRVLAPPLPLPPLRLTMVSARTRRDDPALAWLRAAVRQAIASSGEPAGNARRWRPPA